MIVMYGLNMRSLYSVLDESYNFSNRGRAKAQQIIIEQDRAVKHILHTSQIGKMFLVQGERPETSGFTLALAMKAGLWGKRVNYVTDLYYARSVAACAVGSYLRISEERMVSGWLDNMESKWLKQLRDKHFDSDCLMINNPTHGYMSGDIVYLQGIKEVVEQLDRLGRLNKASWFIVDYLGSWAIDETGKTKSHTAKDLDKVIHYCCYIADKYDVNVVLGCYQDGFQQESSSIEVDLPVKILDYYFEVGLSTTEAFEFESE